MPFQEIFYADVGDGQAMGQLPVTFIRQVTGLSMNPTQTSAYPEDVKRRVSELLGSIRGQSMGTYLGPAGIRLVRQHIADYIQERDGGVPCDPEDIICSNGASGAIKDVLSLFRGKDARGLPAGILCPVPQYPVYKSAICELDLHEVQYYLNEENGWSLEVPELENVLNCSKDVCVPRVLVVINPGNPTGQVLSRHCIEEVVKFAYREKLIIFADEVYQLNAYEPEVAPFHSFKKVMVEMGAPYSSMELASFMSVSKGYAGECGLRGGYVELFNWSPAVKRLFNLILLTHMCPCAIGQVALDCVAKEPKPGDESYELFRKEKEAILGSLKRRAELTTKALNECHRISCTAIRGSMFAFPTLDLPKRAVEAAQKMNLQPDAFYTKELLKSTGEGFFIIQREWDFYLLFYLILKEFAPPLDTLSDKSPELTTCGSPF